MINWYILKFLFDDGIIQQLTINNIEYQKLLLEEQKYKDVISIDQELIKELIKENEVLRALTNKETSIIDIDDERTSTGTKEVDKPSPHSSFSRRQLLQIGKNAIAADKRLYIVQLAGDTNSMEPDMDDNMIYFFEKYDEVAKLTPLNLQDIIQYKHPSHNGYFIHRIVEVKKDNRLNPLKKTKTSYRIKGDNNKYYDGWFTDEVIKGRYCGKLVGKEEDGESDD